MFTRRVLVAYVWIVGGLLFGVAALRALRSDAPEEAIVAGTISVLLTVVGGLTVQGVFERHRGGWPTYVGIAFALFGATGLAVWVGSHFFRAVPAVGQLVFALVSSAVAALLLTLGAIRHATRSQAFLHERT